MSVMHVRNNVSLKNLQKKKQDVESVSKLTLCCSFYSVINLLLQIHPS